MAAAQKKVPQPFYFARLTGKPAGPVTRPSGQAAPETPILRIFLRPSAKVQSAYT